ncbi:MAG: peptide deformylase [Negativicutes bacterium]|nr:peptide deformylase [Negativicutes bacterium]
MAVLPILKVGNPILKKQSNPISKIDKNIKKLIQDMFDTLAEAEGVGLAAPQVGENVRLIVLNMGDGPFEIINPVIIDEVGEQVGVEGCLSVPGFYGDVTRFLQVTVGGINSKGKKVKVTGEGLLARALQHEIDHLDGVLYLDRAEALYKQEPESAGDDEE